MYDVSAKIKFKMLFMYFFRITTICCFCCVCCSSALRISFKITLVMIVFLNVKMSNNFVLCQLRFYWE